MKVCLRYLTLLVVMILPAQMPIHASPKNTQSENSAPLTSKQGYDVAPAELPKMYMDSSLRATPAPGKTVTVRAGDDPSLVLSKASCGDTVQLQAGATFNNLVLPEKKCDDSRWIIVRTSAPDSKLPPEGTRLTPCYAGVSVLPGRPALQCRSTENVVPRIEASGKGNPRAILLAPGANHYRLIGLEVTRADSRSLVYNLIGPDKQPADHIVFDRMWIHGSAQDETVRGIMLSHIRYAAVVDSYLSDFHCIAKSGGCVDSQAIGGGIGDDDMGPFKIVNNFLESAGECILLGGGQATKTPSDIEIRRNHLFRPMTWMRGQPGYIGGIDGNPFIVKNLFELKNAQRVLFEANILENSWGGFTQRGFAVLLTPKNQVSRAGNVCPACQVTDITIRKCKISHVGGGFLIGNGVVNGGAARDGGHYSIQDVIVDDIQADLYNGFGTFAQISMAVGTSESPRLHDVSIDHVTAFPARILFIIGGPRLEPRMRSLAITNSIFTVGTQRIASTGGGVDRNCAAPQGKAPETIFQDCFASYTFHHNVIIGGGGGWPKDNQTPANVTDLGFANYRNGDGGDYRLASTNKFKHTASDRKDVGADLDAIDQATMGVQ